MDSPGKTLASAAARSGANPAESAFFDVFFNNSTEAIFITDPKGRLITANPSFIGITGVDLSAAVGLAPPILASEFHDREFYIALWRTLKRKGGWKGEILQRRASGEICREWLSISSHKNSGGEVTHYVGTFTDASNQMSQSFSKHYYDSLTKLPNRLLLQDRLEFMINHARRNNELMALLLLDVDRFKMINDTFGYEAGDALLQTTADRLLTCVRDVDVVFRSGDDEFAIILEEIAHPEDAAKVARRILKTCSEPLQIDNCEIYATICIGISIFPTDGDGKVQMLQNAEAAMHRAREMGLNCFEHYKPSMNARALERLTLESDLRNALGRCELCAFYQPQVEIKTGRVTGAEALLRWKHPELGMIPPTQFIPIAEDTGLILSIGEWVLRTACFEARKWQKGGAPFVVSVNLSANQFQQENLVSIVESSLSNAGMPPELLELEITESMSMKSPEETLKMLRNLKELGVRIAIDDFGTGYSSLSYLKRFPIDTLKIDRSFLMDIPDSTRDSEIVKAIIAMAHSLNLTVIAEGVEMEPQVQYLLQNGCEKMQGYLFSPPVPVPEFEKIWSIYK
ncbi:MAG: EAL domain-containing protein [Chitinispirillales bacterium]|jgi:diguanylate cyclase (GGDEF)-like protein/PAS domain S-box-containing protein|nr:EAL domain-containing protein [Chitinispirillales bacterium]